MGIGQKMTPIAFVNSCEVFTFTENLTSELKVVGEINIEETETNKGSQPKKVNQKVAKKTKTKSKFPELDIKIIDKAFEISTNEEDEAFIAKVGSSLRKIDPSFDPRTYGFKTLTQLFKSIKKYTIVKNEVNGLNHPLVKLK
jgi:hypothetical protein